MWEKKGEDVYVVKNEGLMLTFFVTGLKKLP